MAKTIPNSVCTKCKRRNTLMLKLVDVSGFEGVWESLVVCVRCGARTHAAYTNTELERLGEALRSQPARTVEEEAARRTAQQVFRDKFDAFNRQIGDDVVKRAVGMGRG